MGFYKKIERLLLCLVNFFWDLFISIHEKKNIRAKKKIYEQIKLTQEQKNQIDDFYIKNYGKKIPYMWHQLYTSYTGKFDYKYVPEYIFSTQIEKIGNRRLDVLPFENKSLLKTLFEGASEYIEIPKTYLMSIKGNYFDENNDPIDLDKAIQIINEKYNKFIIKISTDSNSGRGVSIISMEKGKDEKTGEDIKTIFEKHGDDFVIQELVKQSDIVNKIYSKSINTLRVITYITENEYHVAPIVMRIGQGGNNVDNAHAGGMFIAINNDGSLYEEAYTEYQTRYREHPDTKQIFKNYQLPNIDILIREIVKLHKRIPNIKFISWDIAINEKNYFSLIEANMHSQTVWFPQMAHGKGIFEDNTEIVLKMLRRKKNEEN